MTEEGMSLKNDFHKESQGPDLQDPASGSFWLSWAGSPLGETKEKLNFSK